MKLSSIHTVFPISSLPFAVNLLLQKTSKLIRQNLNAICTITVKSHPARNPCWKYVISALTSCFSPTGSKHTSVSTMPQAGSPVLDTGSENGERSGVRRITNTSRHQTLHSKEEPTFHCARGKKKALLDMAAQAVHRSLAEVSSSHSVRRTDETQRADNRDCISVSSFGGFP